MEFFGWANMFEAYFPAPWLIRELGKRRKRLDIFQVLGVAQSKTVICAPEICLTFGRVACLSA